MEKPADTLLRWSARWFLVVLPLGVWIRSAFVWLYNPGPFTWADLTHAHSHTAYFGWAGLGLMGLILYVLPRLTGRSLERPRSLGWLLWLAPWAVLGQLVTFSLWGYGAASIAFSGINEVVWFLFAHTFWVNVKGRPVREWPAALWLIGVAVALLLLSTVGTLLLVIARVMLHTSSAALANSGVYLFLQAYGDGWLEVGLMGVATALVGGLRSRSMARWQALLMLGLMAPATLRLLVPYGLGGIWVMVGTLSGLGLGVAQLLYLLNMRQAAGRIPALVRPWWLLAAGALALKAVLEVLPLLPAWIVWIDNRSLVIAFLHLKLLLLVSAGLMGAMAYAARVIRGAFGAFTVMSAVMVGALAAHGFWASANPVLSRQLYLVSFVTGLLAALAAAVAVWPTAFSRREPAFAATNGAG